MKVHLLYPEDRWVNHEAIEGWFADQVADGMIPSDWGSTVRDKALALEDLGLITVARDSEF